MKWTPGARPRGNPLHNRSFNSCKNKLNRFWTHSVDNLVKVTPRLTSVLFMSWAKGKGKGREGVGKKIHHVKSNVRWIFAWCQEIQPSSQPSWTRDLQHAILPPGLHFPASLPGLQSSSWSHAAHLYTHEQADGHACTNRSVCACKHYTDSQRRKPYFMCSFIPTGKPRRTDIHKMMRASCLYI